MFLLRLMNNTSECRGSGCGEREEERGEPNDYQMVPYYCAAAATLTLKENSPRFEKAHTVSNYYYLGLLKGNLLKRTFVLVSALTLLIHVLASVYVNRGIVNFNVSDIAVEK